MIVITRRMSAIVCILTLCGCAGVAPKASDLAPPSARLMAPPVPLPDVKEGGDLYDENIACSAKLGIEQGRLRGLQNYARTVTRKN